MLLSEKNNSVVKSPIQEFYKNKCLFITGGTGFLGTVLVEKLLYSCVEINCIYLLIKAKHGNTIEERMAKWLGSAAFQRIRETNPNVINKLIPVVGNLREKNLGLRDQDLWTIQEEVSVVFHVAADVHFNLPISDAVNINTKASEEVAKVVKGFKKLEAFIYVSTAYSNSNRKVIGEKVYKMDLPLKSVYYAVNNFKDNHLIQHLLDGRPNTYTFSKALSENVFANEIHDIPAAIVRPSVIISSLKEPLPGWIQGWSGASVVAATVGKSVLRCWHGSNEAVSDFIPVDTVANLIVASAWDVAKYWKTNKEEIKVFNSCSGLQNPITLKEYLTYSKKYFTENSTFCFPLVIIQNPTLYTILFFILQTIPSLFISALNWITRGQIGILKKLSTAKMYSVASLVEFFTLYEFTFLDHNSRNLYEEMDDIDKEIFDFDVTKVNWEHYLKDFVYGLKKYVLNEK